MVNKQQETLGLKMKAFLMKSVIKPSESPPAEVPDKSSNLKNTVADLKHEMDTQKLLHALEIKENQLNHAAEIQDLKCEIEKWRIQSALHEKYAEKWKYDYECERKITERNFETPIQGALDDAKKYAELLMARTTTELDEVKTQIRKINSTLESSNKNEKKDNSSFSTRFEGLLSKWNKNPSPAEASPSVVVAPPNPRSSEVLPKDEEHSYLSLLENSSRNKSTEHNESSEEGKGVADGKAPNKPSSLSAVDTNGSESGISKTYIEEQSEAISLSDL